MIYILYKAKSKETGEWIYGYFLEMVNPEDPSELLPCIRVVTHHHDDMRLTPIYETKDVEIDPQTLEMCDEIRPESED